MMHAGAKLTVLAVIGASLLGCGKPPSQQPISERVGAGEPSAFAVLDTRTDNFDFGAAKALAEDALAKYPDLACMVGLFAYNPPYILEALRDAGKLGDVQVVGFDEDEATLQAIVDGTRFGTVVQNPYQYGYESVRILAGLARGDESVLPAGGFLNIEARQITRENVDAFWSELKGLLAPDEKAAVARDASRPTVAFVTNGIASFWLVAEKGAQDAAREFDVNLEVRMPPADGAVANQKRMIEELVTIGVDGIAVSPIDPDNQSNFLNEVASQTHLITHDSDAPHTKRRCYVGMDNYLAGRLCGDLVRQAIPDGGNVMIFVGRLEQLNAKLRNDGTVDAVIGKERAADSGDST